MKFSLYVDIINYFQERSKIISLTTESAKEKVGTRCGLLPYLVCFCYVDQTIDLRSQETRRHTRASNHNRKYTCQTCHIVC